MLTICGLNLEASVPRPKGYPENPQTLGQHLKKRRMDEGLTPFEMSLELGVYDTTIYKWEEGVTNPSPENSKKIIAYLGYDPICQNLKNTHYELT